MGASGIQIIPVAAGDTLDTTVTVGNGQYDVEADSGAAPCFAYGYALGVDHLGLGNFGSVGDDTFDDSGSNSRTMSAIYYTETCLGSGDDDNLHFCLDETSVPENTTFVSIDYNGVNYLQSAATYDGTTGSCSTWIWINISPNGPTSGTPDLVVNV